MLIPLHSFAQFGRGYTGPTMQQNMQSRQDFNRMTNQRTQDFQRQSMERTQRRMWNSGQPVSAETKAQAQAKQQKLEQQATDKLSSLAQQQQQRRQQHPAKNAQQAANQLRADTRQLNQLAVKNYQDVFLPGQLTKALEAQQPAPDVQRGLRRLNDNLLSDTWWRKQEGAPVAGTVQAYGDSLARFTTSLLGFELATPPATPAAFSASGLDEQLLKDAFDQNAASQLVQDAGLTERLLASAQLIQVVKEFTALTNTAATDPALQGDPKKLRKEVQKSLRNVAKEMTRYTARLNSGDKLLMAENAQRKSITAYLTKTGK